MIFHPRNAWMPNYNLSMWKNTKLGKMATVVISFHQGVTLERDATLTIPEEEGLYTAGGGQSEEY
jgi:hypothetical protein